MIRKIRPIINDKNNTVKNTVLYAATELQKYLSLVSDWDFPIIPADFYDKTENNALYLGINFSDLIPDVEDCELDDAIVIKTVNHCGFITGTNGRSVLIGTYRYLRELGFEFIRPGVNGEYYPDAISSKNVFICEKASYRHRTICMEGSIYQKNLTDTIDWLPKVGLNGYFVQFKLPRTFLERWYSEDTPYREKTSLSDSDISSIINQAETEIQKRNLMYHAVGHGWTAQALGFDGSSWDTCDNVSLHCSDIAALVNGKRELWKGIPQNTNLCYSNIKARNLMVDTIVDYCRNHLNVTYLHVWLADADNNNCECDECRKKRTSDYYIQILNELDEKLTAGNIKTRIVFLLYCDLLWKPLYERFANSSRFVLMFAPITRSYTIGFNPDCSGEVAPYELNNLKMPESVDENIAYLRDWQKDFQCDSFDFDYHFMWDHYYDFARYKLDKVLWSDVRNLKAIGLNGFVSCQAQRAFMPTCVGMNVLARTLWNKHTEFDEVADHILKIEFCNYYCDVKKYLSELSELGCAEALRCEEKITDPSCIEKIRKALAVIGEFKSTIRNQIELSNEKNKKSWKKLGFHSDLYEMILKFYLDVAVNKKIGDYSHIKDFVLKNEAEYKEEFDAWCFFETFNFHVVNRLKKCIEI